jgi:hypothetical protein
VNAVERRTASSNFSRSDKQADDTRRPVWLEATESFYKKLNRIAKECCCAAQEFHKVLKLAESLPFVTKSSGISPSILVMQTAEY